VLFGITECGYHVASTWFPCTLSIIQSCCGSILKQLHSAESLSPDLPASLLERRLFPIACRVSSSHVPLRMERGVPDGSSGLQISGGASVGAQRRRTSGTLRSNPGKLRVISTRQGIYFASRPDDTACVDFCRSHVNHRPTPLQSTGGTPDRYGSIHPNVILDACRDDPLSSLSSECVAVRNRRGAFPVLSYLLSCRSSVAPES
jgi:hypothetical protein